MNTPSHMLLNLALLDHGISRGLTFPIIIGALIPDIPIALLYVIDKIVFYKQDSVIWKKDYQEWRWVFDSFHSILFTSFGMLIGLLIGSVAVRFFFLSWLLHIVFDFPFHNSDAHAHLFPVSKLRFRSPISYWDLNHYGKLGATLELMLVTASSLVLWHRYSQFWPRLALAASFILIFMYGLVFLARQPATLKGYLRNPRGCNRSFWFEIRSRKAMRMLGEQMKDLEKQ